MLHLQSWSSLAYSACEGGAFDFWHVSGNLIFFLPLWWLLFSANTDSHVKTLLPLQGNFQKSFWRTLQLTKSSHMAAPICAHLEAVGGQGRGRTRPGANRSGRLWVADLWDHIIRLPALQFLPHKPVHLICVASETLILTDRKRFIYSTLTQEWRLLCLICFGYLKCCFLCVLLQKFCYNSSLAVNLLSLLKDLCCHCC